jgi:hypothetical protein
MSSEVANTAAVATDAVAAATTATAAAVAVTVAVAVFVLPTDDAIVDLIRDYQWTTAAASLASEVAKSTKKKRVGSKYSCDFL